MADQSTLLRVHKILVLSAVEFRSTIKKLGPHPQQGLAYGNFLYKPHPKLIEHGESTLQQRREIKTANMAVKITTKPEHPMHRHLKNKKAYDQYRLAQTKPNYLFLRQSQRNLLHMLEVDLKDVDQMVQPEYTPFITNREVNIDTTMLLSSPQGI
jgi:hypothetical protein